MKNTFLIQAFFALVILTLTACGHKGPPTPQDDPPAKNRSAPTILSSSIQ